MRLNLDLPLEKAGVLVTVDYWIKFDRKFFCAVEKLRKKVL